MNGDLFFYHCFSSLSVKTDINEKGLNLKSPERSKAFKAQLAAT